MTAELPVDRPVLECDPVAARALLVARPTEYYKDEDGYAVRVDSLWEAWMAGGGTPIWRIRPMFSRESTTFLHERHTPSGQRRLVMVEGWAQVTVFEPAGLLSGGPRVVKRGIAVLDKECDAIVNIAYSSQGDTRLYAGIADPADKSRFTSAFMLNGAAGMWEFVLEDDDRVTMRLLDQNSFIARLKAVGQSTHH